MKRSRRSSNFMSSDKMGNESILTLIFVHLPIISLMRFKSVCKLWLSLVTSPYFAHSHTITSIGKNPSFLTPSGFFIFNSLDNQVTSVSLSKTRRRIKPSLPSLSFLGQNFKILQSCNGLLLCQLSCGTSCVCNPTTGKFKILPSVPKMYGEFSWVSPFTLAFDPSKSPNYRVVCFKKSGSNNLQIFMYLSETGCWNASTRFKVNVCLNIGAGIFSNGAILWQCHEYICFDLNEEKVRLLRLPFMNGVQQCLCRILCLWRWCDSVYSSIQISFVWDLHELDQSTFEWTEQKYNIPAKHISRLAFNVVKKEGKTEQSKYNPGEFNWSVLAIVKGENEKDTVVLVAILGKVFSYNFARRKVKVIFDLGLPSDVAGNVCRNCLGAYQYVQTLSPV